jgi:recombinational DNA repair protein (RecF pathway)
MQCPRCGRSGDDVVIEPTTGAVVCHMCMADHSPQALRRRRRWWSWPQMIFLLTLYFGTIIGLGTCLCVLSGE